MDEAMTTTAGVTEVLRYGTAVIVEPLQAYLEESVD